MGGEIIILFNNELHEEAIRIIMDKPGLPFGHLKAKFDRLRNFLNQKRYEIYIFFKSFGF